MAFRLFKLFTSVCFFSFGTEEYACSRWEFLACLHFIPRSPHGLPWHACVKDYKLSSWTRPNCLPLKTFFSLPLGVRVSRPFLSCDGSTLCNIVDQKNNIVAPFQFCRYHQILFFEIREIFSHNWFWIDEVLQRAGCFDFLWSTAIRARDSSLLRKLQLGQSRSSFEIPFSHGIFTDESPRWDYSEFVMPLEYKSQ